MTPVLARRLRWMPRWMPTGRGGRRRLLLGGLVLALAACRGGVGPEGGAGAAGGAAGQDLDRSSSELLFCEWDHREELFLAALDDYRLGNRRATEAWAILNSPSSPGKDHKEQRGCWQAALYYLGIFGARSELTRLLQLADKDPLLDAETVHVSSPNGASELGESRSVAHRIVFLALGAQLRRQMMFDGVLDSDGQAADALIRGCALDRSQCMSNSQMHQYRRDRLQRNAIRALAIAGTTADLAVLQIIRSDLPNLHFLIRHAVGDADIFGRKIRDNYSIIKQNIPGL